MCRCSSCLPFLKFSLLPFFLFFSHLAVRDVLVKRFVFRNSVEESVVELHGRVKAGAAAISDAHFPADLVALLASK